MTIASPPTSNLIETKSILPMRFQVVLFAIVRMIININTRMVYPFLSTFASGLGVDLVSISLAMTVRSISGAFSLFITPLADQRGRKTGMLLGVAIFIVGAALVMVWPSFTAFTIAISLTFLGMFVYLSSTQAYIGDRVRKGRRGTALGLIETGWGVSYIIGMPILGWIIDRYGWRSAFPVYRSAGCAGISPDPCFRAQLQTATKGPFGQRNEKHPRGAQNPRRALRFVDEPDADLVQRGHQPGLRSMA